MKDWYIFKVINAICGHKLAALSSLIKTRFIFSIKRTSERKVIPLLNHKSLNGSYVFLTSIVHVVLSHLEYPPRIHCLGGYLVLVENRNIHPP
jgi:hypothetical protein